MDRPLTRELTARARRVRPGVALAVLALHIVAIAALVRAFAPQWLPATVRSATAAFDVPLAKRPPTPPPAPVRPIKAADEGTAASMGKKAVPRAITAPKATVPLAQASAPSVASTGAANSAGVAASGQGTGAGGAGLGLGAGGAGDGAGGGGGACKVAKIAGDIVSTRDYPAAGRELRRGSAVTIALSVDAEGRVQGCRVVRPSRDPEADRITCRLAAERFRFRPAQDASGRAIASVYGWQQRWFAPGS